MCRLIEPALAASILIGMGLLAASNTPAQEQGASGQKPAWADLFVDLGMYNLTFGKPVVGKGDKPEVYQQKGTYTWTGGRYEVIHVTLARDPAFKEKYSAEALKKEANPPKELEINKKKAWQWTFSQDAGKFNRLAHRLVVLLDIDKAIIFEQFGFGVSLPEEAKKFDFAKIEKALANPPK
jgi:hypothetical protein